MVPSKEFEALTQFYKGKITESALLNKAGRLAAEEHLILRNKKIPANTAMKMVKPRATERARLTKRIRLGPGSGGGPDPTLGDKEGIADAPLEKMLHRILKSVEQPRRPPLPPRPRPGPRPGPGPRPAPRPGPTPKPGPAPKPHSTPKTSRIPIPYDTPRTSRLGDKENDSPAVSKFKRAVRGVARGTEKVLEATGKGRELQKLKPRRGWESWEPQGGKNKKRV